MDNGVAVPHQVVFIVTDVTKEIDGVPAVVVWDRDFTNGQLLEEELTFEAQDAAGNVWNLGEYPEEHENGQFAGAPNAWLSGQANATGRAADAGRSQDGDRELRAGLLP